MTAAVNLRVISILMHTETMQLYQVHYVGRIKHKQYRTEYAAQCFLASSGFVERTNAKCLKK